MLYINTHEITSKYAFHPKIDARLKIPFMVLYNHKLNEPKPPPFSVQIIVLSYEK